MFGTPPQLLACFLARLKDNASPNPKDVDVGGPTRRAHFVSLMASWAVVDIELTKRYMGLGRKHQCPNSPPPPQNDKLIVPLSSIPSPTAVNAKTP